MRNIQADTNCDNLRLNTVKAEIITREKFIQVDGQRTN